MIETGVVLLASYPKTGSTWLKWLIAEAVASGTSIDDFMPSFGKRFPDAKAFSAGGNSYRFVKTHFHPGHAGFAAFQGPLEAVVSIRRHPLDILLSSLNYAMVKNEIRCFLRGEPKKVSRIVADGEMQHYIDEFIANDGFPWYAKGTGPFSLFQKCWRAEGERVRYLELCYEDMVAAPNDSVARLVSFLGLDADSDKIRAIVKNAEVRTKPDGGMYWMRRAHNYREFLPVEMYLNFNARYKPVLEELGYPVIE